MSAEDKAQEIELKEWKRINERPTSQTRFEPHEPGYGPEECDECGAVMPTQRREWGFNLCVNCKQIEEFKSKPYA